MKKSAADEKTLAAIAANFDHHAPEFRENTYAVYKYMQSKCPIAYSKNHGGYWVLTRYKDIMEVARDDVNFSSADGVTVPSSIGYGRLPSIPIENDPPEATAYRMLLTKLVSPKVMQRLDKEFYSVANDLIDRFIETGEADLAGQLGRPMTGIMTLRLLGMRVENWPIYSESVHANIYHIGTDEYRNRLNVRYIETLRGEVAEIKKNPNGGTVAYLHEAEIDGRKLTIDEIEGMVNLLIIGGLDTTAACMSSAFVHMAQNPDIKEKLRADPSLIPDAVEEYLRFWAPQQGLARTVLKDYELDGVTLKKGDRLMMFWAAANRDPAEFENPDQFVLGREPNRHVTFGVGSHRCLGSHLGRKEIAVCIEEVLRRIPDYTVLEDRLQLPPSVGTVYGFESVPVRFKPGKREGSGA